MFSLGICYNILFPTYFTLNDGTGEIKCIKIQSFNRIHEYTFDDSKDIEIVMDYLYALKYREHNIYEKIKRRITTQEHIATTIGFKIYLYTSIECKESDLIKTIKISRGYGITVNGRRYILSDKEINPYIDLYHIIHEEIIGD